jgi:hypothetical protein
MKKVANLMHFGSNSTNDERENDRNDGNIKDVNDRSAGSICEVMPLQPLRIRTNMYYNMKSCALN